MKTATSMAGLIPPPASRPTPRTTDSGSPSSNAPTAMAVPLPGASCSEGCWPPDLLRCLAPTRARSMFAPTYTTAPVRKPPAVGHRPPPWTASSTRSKARAEISTPAPKAMTVETTFGGIAHRQDTAAPRTSAAPAPVPHTIEVNQVGRCPPSPVQRG